MRVNLKTIIIASGQRPRHLAILANQLNNYILYIDDSRSSKTGLLNALSRLPAIDMATHYLILQEDIIVCKDFIHTVKKIVNKYPDRLISYFTPKRLSGGTLIKSYNFCYAQAYSLPRQMAIEIIDFTSDKKTDDGHINKYLVSTNQYHLLTNPSLVEHLGWDHTTLPHEKARLQTYDKRRMAGNFIGLENSGLEVEWDLI